MTTNKRPVDHVRVGAISVAIWQNEGSRGTPVYNATADRLYRDRETGEWHTTSSFGRDDLLLLAKAADAAHTRICELQALDRASKDKRDPQDSGNRGEDGAPDSAAFQEADAAHEQATHDDGASSAATPVRTKARAKAAGASR